MTPLRAFVYLVSVVSTLGSLALLLTTLVIGVQRRRDVKALWRTGLVYALGGAALGVPMLALVSARLDPTALGTQLAPGLAGTVKAIVIGAQVAGAVLGFFYLSIEIPVAAIVARDRRSFPLLLGGPDPLRGWAPAAALGIVAGIVSIVGFRLLAIELGSDMQTILKALPSVNWNAPSVLFGATLPAVVGAAVSEEITYRGVLQPLLAGPSGASRAREYAAIGFTSLLWALAHAPNTASPFVKLAQIFVIGIVFGKLSRRYGVEASMLAHAALNAVAVGASLFLH